MSSDRSTPPGDEARPNGPSPFDQAAYQVRLEWGAAGLGRLAPVDVVVVVDVLGFSTRLTLLLAASPATPIPLADARLAWSGNGANIAREATVADDGEAPLVLFGCLRNARAVAQACLAIQARRGRRTRIAIIAAGEQESAGGQVTDHLRFAMEDHLGAGAIVAALSEVGIDHTSPEAAVACEAALGLGGSVRHLIGACGSAREVSARGQSAEIVAACETNASSVVPVLEDGAIGVFQ